MANIRALVTAQQFRITHPSEDDLPQKERVVFVFQALSARAQAHIRDQSMDITMGEVGEDGEAKPEVTTRNGLAMLLQAQMSLAAIENLQAPVLGDDGTPVHGEDGEQVFEPYETGREVVALGGGAKWTCIREEDMDVLPDSIRTWCSTKSQELNKPRKDDEKNLDA